MANAYFQFKQFRIEQGGAAMKVGTDGVLLGAWAPLEEARNALDVGTGTGLLALMLAQRKADLQVTALELDPLAASQADHNVGASAWAERISVVEGDFKAYTRETTERFDLLVCNPPYFQSGPTAPLPSRAIARHGGELDFVDLLDGAELVLHKGGGLAVVLPALQWPAFEQAARHRGWVLHRKLVVYPTPQKEAVRILGYWRQTAGPVFQEALTLEIGGRHVYSPQYLALTRDFYLFA